MILDTSVARTRALPRLRPDPDVMRRPRGLERTVMTTATKVRLRFAKHGDFRLVSHHDLMRCLERTLRRARIPTALSQGFNPRARVAFPLALALGIEGRREVVELDLAGPIEPAEILRRLASATPPGLDWIDAEAPGPGRAAQAVAVEYTLEIPADRHDATRARLDELLASTRWPCTRRRPDRDRDVEIDLRPFVLEAALDSFGLLRFRMKIAPSGSARPEEMLGVLGLHDLLGQGAVLVRTDVELAP